MATTQTQPASSGKGFAIASLVIGIVAFFLGFIPFLTLIVAIVGLIFGILGLKGSKGMAIAGIVLCSIAILWGVFYNGAILKNTKDGKFQVGTPSSTTTTPPTTP